jgi:hypothetical protein
MPYRGIILLQSFPRVDSRLAWSAAKAPFPMGGHGSALRSELWGRCYPANPASCQGLLPTWRTKLPKEMGCAARHEWCSRTGYRSNPLPDRDPWVA